MTDAQKEAVVLLKESDNQGWIDWDDKKNCPDVRTYNKTQTIGLDGEFSKEELLALLVFFQ